MLYPSSRYPEDGGKAGRHLQGFHIFLCVFQCGHIVHIETRNRNNKNTHPQDEKYTTHSKEKNSVMMSHSRRQEETHKN
jgi:hypothetical protein